MKVKTIGVFFGGKSPEHEVSIITGQLVISQLEKMGYVVWPIYLDKKGDWLIGKELGRLKFFTKTDGSTDQAGFKKFSLTPPSEKKQLIFQERRFFGKKIELDLAFPCFHGMNGEDGTIQGLFEIFRIPYVGSNVSASAITIDKVITKKLFLAQGIKTTRFLSFLKTDWENNHSAIVDKIEKEIVYPLFVKPAKLGSSIGISKVKNTKELKTACDLAFYYDEKILIEEAVEEVLDITCAVREKEAGDLQTSLIQESSFRDDFFSYEDKYLENGGGQLGKDEKNIFIPARIKTNIKEDVQKISKQIFSFFGLSGTARVDFLLDKKRQIIFANEINTLPGTLYHHLWEKSGVSLDRLLEDLILVAVKNFQNKKQVNPMFQSNLLQMAGSIKLGLEDKNL